MAAAGSSKTPEELGYELKYELDSNPTPDYANVKKLIDAGASFMVEFSEQNPYRPLSVLIYACETGSEKAIEMMIDSGRLTPDIINYTDFATPNSALITIILAQDVDIETKIRIVRLLVKNGADITTNKKYLTDLLTKKNLMGILVGLHDENVYCNKELMEILKISSDCELGARTPAVVGGAGAGAPPVPPRRGGRRRSCRRSTRRNRRASRRRRH